MPTIGTNIITEIRIGETEILNAYSAENPVWIGFSEGVEAPQILQFARLDGVDDYITFSPTFLDYSTGFTVEFVVTADLVGDWHRFFSIDDGSLRNTINIANGSDKTDPMGLYAEVIVGGSKKIINITDAYLENTKAHIALTIGTNGTVRLYKDAVEIGQVTGSALPYILMSNGVIGYNAFKNQSNGGWFTKSDFYYFRIWSYERNAVQLAETMNAQLEQESGLVTNYKFAGNFNDSSGNENHATPINGAHIISTFPASDQNGIYIEVENADVIGSKYISATSPLASGGVMLKSTDESTTNTNPNPPDATTTIQFNVELEAGTFDLWVRWEAGNNDGNSIYYKLPGQSVWSVSPNNNPWTSGFVWEKMQSSFTVATGVHSIYLGQREACRPDAIYLTKTGGVPIEF